MSKSTMYLTRTAENRYWSINNESGDYYDIAVKNPYNGSISMHKMKITDYQRVDCYPTNIPCSRATRE